MMNRNVSNVLVGLLLLLIAGCGFHLRGAVVLPESLQSIYVQGIDITQGLGEELVQSLGDNDVNVVHSYQEGSAVLTVLENKYERRVLSVGSDAKASEYSLYGLVQFKVTDGEGSILSEAQAVEAMRDYQFDQTQVLGKSEEEDLLREDLNRQLVQSILRRLSAIK